MNLTQPAEKILPFEFATATRIVFGAGSLELLGGIAAGFGRRALVVTGMPGALTEPVLAQLAKKSIETTTFAVSQEPTTTLVMQGVQAARQAGAELVIGFGGGSAIDTAKSIAAMLTNPGELLDYLEVVGRGQPLTEQPAPFIAIPTTAGTGAEVTRNAVLASPEHQVKVSLRSPMMLARVALLDPELTTSMPPAVTASTGMDALTQCIEPFLSNAANPLVDALCRDGIRRAAQALPHAYRDGTDAIAREEMLLASLFGGLALANAKLGAVHGFAGVLGGLYPAPHGAICAALLPYVMTVNLRLLQARHPDHPVLPRFQEVAQLVCGPIVGENRPVTSADGVQRLQELARELNIPGLAAFGVQAADFGRISAQAAKASSMKGNPIRLTDEELEEILILAL